MDELPDQTPPSLTPEERVIAAVDRRLANRLLDPPAGRRREVLVLSSWSDCAIDPAGAKKRRDFRPAGIPCGPLTPMRERLGRAAVR